MSDKLSSRNERQAQLVRNLRWGVGWGLVGASLLGAFVLLQFLFGALEGRALGIGAILIIYSVTGIFGGLILGVLRPIASKRSGAVLIAFLIAIPFAITVRFAKWGFSPWTRGDTIGVLIGASLLAFIYGVSLHHRLSGDADE